MASRMLRGRAVNEVGSRICEPGAGRLERRFRTAAWRCAGRLPAARCAGRSTGLGYRLPALFPVGRPVAIEFNADARHYVFWLAKVDFWESAMRIWTYRTVLMSLLSVILVSGALAADTGAQSSEKQHRLLIQVNQNDPAVMNLALNNATNVIEYYRSKGEDVAVDIVTYGPGLHMLRADTSPVRDRIKQLKDVAFPNKIQFSACNVTKQGMEKREGHAIDIMSDAVVVPSGVIHMMELQEKGWSYIRP
jgi:uncharacterized protein